MHADHETGRDQKVAGRETIAWESNKTPMMATMVRAKPPTKRKLRPSRVSESVSLILSKVYAPSVEIHVGRGAKIKIFYHESRDEGSNRILGFVTAQQQKPVWMQSKPWLHVLDVFGRGLRGGEG